MEDVTVRDIDPSAPAIGEENIPNFVTIFNNEKARIRELSNEEICRHLRFLESLVQKSKAEIQAGRVEIDERLRRADFEEREKILEADKKYRPEKREVVKVAKKKLTSGEKAIDSLERQIGIDGKKDLFARLAALAESKKKVTVEEEIAVIEESLTEEEKAALQS